MPASPRARGRFIQLLNNDTEVTAGWIEAGLAPFADPSVGSVAPLVLVRSEPARVDSAGDSYTLVGWPTKRGHGQPARCSPAAPSKKSSVPAGRVRFYRADVLKRLGGFDPLYGSYYEDVDLAFRLRWAGYRCVFAPTCVIFHDVSATYDHRSPALQRRMSRNAELLFWTNMPARLLVIALLPRLSFLAAQALWRLARGRASPLPAGQARRRQSLARNPRPPPRAPHARPQSPVSTSFRPGHRDAARRAADEPTALDDDHGLLRAPDG